MTMAHIGKRARQDDLADIPVPGDLQNNSNAADKPDILSAVSSSTVTSIPAPTNAGASQTASASPSPSPTPTGLSPAEKAAIIVPIVALVLLLPLVVLLYRSHQLRKAIEKRASQRSSVREAMIQHRSSKSEGDTSTAAAFRQLDRPKAAPAPSQQLHNSLGLFNFDLSPPRTPDISSPTSPKSPGRLSIAHLMPVRRSQVSVVQGGPRHSRARSPNSGRSEPSMLLPGPPSPLNPRFAPLDQIGVAHSRDSSRPTLHRNISSQSSKTQRFTEHPQPSEAYYPTPRSPSPNRLPEIPQGRFTISDYLRSRNRTPASLDKCGEPAAMPTQIKRYSDVSSLSDEDHDHERNSHSVSPVKDNAGVQPYRLV